MCAQPAKRTTRIKNEAEPAVVVRNDLHDRLQLMYPGIEVPRDISHAPPMNGRSAVPPFYTAYESSCDPTVQPTMNNDTTDARRSDTKRKKTGGNKRKREPTLEDKLYRADREFVKRQSHLKMIWFFRNLNVRHPAAIRTHLERVKHSEFELPNLQCVFPHPELSIALDENADGAASCGGDGFEHNGATGSSATANFTYYNLYCATPALVERVRSMMGTSKRCDQHYNKRLIAFVADIVGRLLWHTNRTHAVMFAKADHYDRDCFLLYSRQTEPTPLMMRSDTYFCRRHDSDRYRFFAPQPDLTRSNSGRLSHESSIYVVGCSLFELWDTFPYEYRVTHCRPMKPLCDRIRQIDASVLGHAFSAINAYLNGDREQSPYVEVAASTSFDLLSVLLRDTDLRDTTTDDSTAYREFLERFITVATLNVHAALKAYYETKAYGGYRDTGVRLPSAARLDHVVLHHIHHRREIRSLRTNRVYYYRNAENFVCSHSLLDDKFEDRRVVSDAEIANRKPVYFYDVFNPSEYAQETAAEVNGLSLTYWIDVTQMIAESSHTIGQYLTPQVLRDPLPRDPFYPPSDMSDTDLAVDRMLERAIKHAKKLKLPSSLACATRDGGHPQPDTAPRGNNADAEQRDDLEAFVRNTIERSITKAGENRMRDGYASPTRYDFETTVTHGGEEIPVQVRVGHGGRQMTRVDYGASGPNVQVMYSLVCAYLIDPTDTIQVRMIPGSRITDSSRGSDYVPLKPSDRIVRVFCIQAMGVAEDSSYLVQPYVYLIFRNMPYAKVDDSSIEEMFQDTQAYGGFHGFRVFDEFRQPNDTVAPPPSPTCTTTDTTGHYVNCGDVKVEEDGIAASEQQHYQQPPQWDPFGTEIDVATMQPENAVCENPQHSADALDAIFRELNCVLDP